MQVTFDLESIEGVAIGTAHGPLTLGVIKESAEKMLGVVQGARVRLLWDLRDARFDLELDEVRGLGEFIKQLSPPRAYRSAFVVSRDLEFGLLRMFEVYRESTDTATSVFRDKRDAVDSLTDDSG